MSAASRFLFWLLPRGAAAPFRPPVPPAVPENALLWRGEPLAWRGEILTWR